jgi:aryl-alcohol dehydrogenase-like predicted oxidoreductase
MADNSRVILGGGAWYDWSPSELSKLLITAAQMGVSNIDTAPSYGKSEYLLGHVLKDAPKFKISTKVGKAGSFALNGEMVFASLEKSLKVLCLEKIDSVYLHSVGFEFVKESAITALLQLKQLGIINKIGVSCDGADFNNFYHLSVFDKFMMTLNLIDQVNLKNCIIVSDDGLGVVLKRSLANGVFRNDYKSILLKYMRIYNKEILGGEQDSYYFRHKVMSKKFGKRLKYSDYAKFAFHSVPMSEVLIGTKNVSHLKNFCEIEKLLEFSEIEIERFKNLFLNSNLFNWRAQT